MEYQKIDERDNTKEYCFIRENAMLDELRTWRERQLKDWCEISYVFTTRTKSYFICLLISVRDIFHGDFILVTPIRITSIKASYLHSPLDT